MFPNENHCPLLLSFAVPGRRGHARARPRCQPLPHPGSAYPASVDLPVAVLVGRGLPATEWNSDTTPSITWTEWTPGARKWKTLAADYPAAGVEWRMLHHSEPRSFVSNGFDHFVR